MNQQSQSPTATANATDIAELIRQAVAHHEAGCYDQMEMVSRQLINRVPRDGVAWHLLAISYLMRGLTRDALEPLRRALTFKPDYAEAHGNLGNALHDLGRNAEAEACYRRALLIKPQVAELHNNLGNVLKDLGRNDEALDTYRSALKLKPDYAEALNNQAKTLLSLGRLAEAIAALKHAVQIRPEFAEAYCNLGAALADSGRLDDATAAYRRAVALNPGYVEAHEKMGRAFAALGRFPDAIKSLRTALAIRPDHAAGYVYLGSIQDEQGHYADALSSFKQALKIQPDLAEAYAGMGRLLMNLGRPSESADSYRRALESSPDFGYAHSNLLFALNYHPDKSGEEIYEAYREYDERFGKPQRAGWREHGNSREVGRRLKVGYVSPDFNIHAVTNFLEPLLASHDKAAVEVYAYAELKREDEVTARYRSYVDHWLATRGMTDDALAERIRADGIDILVDVAGHTAGNRLEVFARKPAPVSVSWLGYSYTTGLSAIDYFLTDTTCAPEGSEGLFAETPWRLAVPSLVYRPTLGMGEVSALPALERGQVTFGTLTRAVRINHRTIRVWAEILKQVPRSRLVIDSRNFQDDALRESLEGQFAEHGIGRERLEIGFHSPPWEVLRGMDIGLDCFPHNSGTTLFETLYMGVPYVTLAGRPSVGRLGGSILVGAGHPEWIARSEAEYIEKAVALASDLPKLAEIRSRLRGEMADGPLLDEAGFARHVEAAYRDMWNQWSETQK